MLTLIDEYSRTCLVVHCARHIGADEVIEQLADAMIVDGIPNDIRSDNGPEFIANRLREWLQNLGVQTAYIEPGSPWENGHRESFNGTLRAELLNGEFFYSAKEAQAHVDRRVRHYNRPDRTARWAANRERLRSDRQRQRRTHAQPCTDLRCKDSLVTWY